MELVHFLHKTNYQQLCRGLCNELYLYFIKNCNAYNIWQTSVRDREWRRRICKSEASIGAEGGMATSGFEEA